MNRVKGGWSVRESPRGGDRVVGTTSRNPKVGYGKGESLDVRKIH